MSIGLCGDPLYFKEENCGACGAEPKYAGKSRGGGGHEEKKIKLLIDQMEEALSKLSDQNEQKLMLNGICGHCGAGKDFWNETRYINTLDKIRRTNAEETLRAYKFRIGSNKQRKAKKCLAVIIRNGKKLAELIKLE